VIFKKPKLKLIISGLAVVFVVAGPLLFKPDVALAAGRRFYPDGIKFDTHAPSTLYKVTKDEIKNGKKDAPVMEVKLREAKSGKASDTPESSFRFNSDDQPDLFHRTSTLSLVGYELQEVWMGVVENLEDCKTTAGGFDCPADDGYGIITSAPSEWKVGDIRSTTVVLDYANIKVINQYANSDSADTRAFDLYIVPSLVIFGNDISLTGNALKIQVKVFKDEETKNADTTQDTPTTTTQGQEQNGGIAGALGDIINQAVTYIVLVLTRIIYWLFSMVVAPLIESLLQIQPHTDIFVETIFLGWQLMRNLCNIFFIVVLLVIGLATLFRVEGYNYKHLLVKVVIAALLVNFSLVFGQAVLGIADTVQSQFLPNSTNVVRALGSKLMVEPINELTSSANYVGNTAGASFAGIAKPVFVFVLALGGFFGFIAIGAFLIIRIVALWILLMFSPLAYVANILPISASYGKQWWQKFLSYAFMGPVLAFFLNLTAVFATTTLANKEKFSELLTKNGVNGDVSQFVYIGASQILIILFLLIGMKVASSSGIYGAGAVMDFAQKGTKMPFLAGAAAGAGTARFAGRWAGRGIKAGAERGFEGIQNKMGVTLDPRLYKKAGTEYFAEQKQRRLQARATRGLFGIEGAPKFGDAKSNLEAYVNFRGAKRAIWDSKLGLRGAGYNQGKAEEAEEREKLLTDEEVKAKEKEKNDLVNQGLSDKPNLANLQKEVQNLESQQYHPKDARHDPALQEKIDEKKKELAEAEKKKSEIDKQKAEISKALADDKKHKEDMGMKDWRNDWKEADKEKAKREKGFYERMISKTKRPEGYAAIAAHHHLLSDEEKKISHIDDHGRLIQLYQDAIAQGERFKAEAVLHKLAKDTNFNELATKLKGGMSFDITKEIFEDFAKAFKLDKHTMLEVASEVGYINEGVKMFNGARLTNIDKHGHAEWASDAQHFGEIKAQMKKVDPRTSARQFWRGAYLDETEDEHANKTFTMHEAGLTVLKETFHNAAGMKAIAGEMQEYNRDAIYKALERQHGTGNAIVDELWNDETFRKALKGKPPSGS
jgi:hypothetical protein